MGTENVLIWKEIMQQLPLFNEVEISLEKQRVCLVELNKTLLKSKEKTEQADPSV